MHASDAHPNEISTGRNECVPKRLSEKDKESSYGFDSNLTWHMRNRERSLGNGLRAERS